MSKIILDIFPKFLGWGPRGDEVPRQSPTFA